MEDAEDAALYRRVTAWVDADPDPDARAELRALLDQWPASRDTLAQRFSGPLRFGTAGLRGPLRAGPAGMNRAVVRTATAGLVRWLADQQAPGPLVVGYDARHGSRAFAEETARIATGAGRDALLLPGPLPTPVLAYAVRACDAAAGVMVTASHNPPADNGYKVYLGAGLGGDCGAGAQLAPPDDAAIEEAIRASGPASLLPLGPPATPLTTDTVDAYVAAAAGTIAGTAGTRGIAGTAGTRGIAGTGGTGADLRVAYTPLHGVGGDVFHAAMTRAGFAAPLAVPEQASPDPDFPTVAFPNPEEPGATDALLQLAAAHGADLALAHDPDADRCAVAVPAGDRPDDPAAWRALTGDEVGVLLADALMRRGMPGTYATTVVSSTQLAALCAARGFPYAETLTGFKWLARAAADLAYGYEEALGYCVAPHLVRDKDGITAGLAVCALAAELRATGQTLAGRLDALAAETGVHATAQVSVRFDTAEEAARAVAGVRADPPDTLLGAPVTAAHDRLPDADLLTVHSERARLVVRPSGTEPKLKAYLEVVEPCDDVAAVPAARARAAEALQALRAEVSARLGAAG